MTLSVAVIVAVVVIVVVIVRERLRPPGENEMAVCTAVRVAMDVVSMPMQDADIRTAHVVGNRSQPMVARGRRRNYPHYGAGKPRCRLSDLV